MRNIQQLSLAVLCLLNIAVTAHAQSTVHYLNAGEMQQPPVATAPAPAETAPASNNPAPTVKYLDDDTSVPSTVTLVAPTPVAPVPVSPPHVSVPITLPAPQAVVPPPAAAPAILPTPKPAIIVAPVTPSATLPPATTGVSSPQAYVMQAGDHIHLTVYDETDLSGDYVVADTGFVSLPLIGNITAANTTTHQLEDAIKAKLQNGYLHDPKVSVQLLNYRPFFILGEVSKPGSYPYVDGMNVLNAVALAGGYTYRASTSRIKIIHGNDTDKKELNVEETEAVMPGDIIKVPERYF